MNWKKTFIAALFAAVALNFASLVQAQETRTLKDYINKYFGTELGANYDF